MTRALFDTNTLASGFVTAGGVGDQLLQRWLLGHFELVISVAASARVDYLVTGDRRFRETVGIYEGVTLVTPRDFLTILDAEADEQP